MKKKINMKKWLLYTYIVLATMLTGTSCITDNDDLPDCPTPKPSEEAPAVRAGLYCNEKLIAWEDGKSIGIYMIDNATESLLNDSLGAPYILNSAATGLFLPQWGVGEQIIKRPPFGVIYDALGIYPYGTSLKNTKSISLSIADQSNQDKLDVFIPRRVHGITNETDSIQLDFYRRMSRLLFNLKLTEVKADKTEVEANDKLTGATILVNGLPVDGTFQLDNDKLETGEAKVFQAYAAENGKQGQAIVFPNKSTKDIRFQVSIPQYPDTLYSFVLDKDLTFESCHSYVLDFDMKYVQRPIIKQYNVKYRYEGKANKDNVTVTRSTTPIAWGEGDIIRLDENNDFTFRYTSDLKVSVRTEDGQTLSMTSGQPYTFKNIQKDITIIIYADEEVKPDPEPEVKHKITYRYEGEANVNNVHVFKNGMTDAWSLNQTLEVKDKANYTFGYNSSMIVTVKTQNGGTLSITSGKPYTFTNITSDIEIIISAVTPEYAVKYIFEGEYTEANVKVQKEKGSSSFEAWAKTQTVYVTEGNNFTFKPNSNYKVTVMVNGKPLDKNADGASYTIKNIYENKLIIISTNIHKVSYEYIGGATKDNVSVYKTNSFTSTDLWTEKTEEILVDHDTDFTFGTYSEHEVAATGNKVVLTANPVPDSRGKNTFKLEKVSRDIIVLINAHTEENLFIHDVEYKFIGNANDNNTTVTTSASAWETDVIQKVNDGESFSFTASSKYTLTVTAKFTNDLSVDVPIIKTGDTYTIHNIKKNVIISIEAIIWKVNFSYSGDYVDATRVPVYKEEDGVSTKWDTNYTVKADNDNNFTFENKSDKYTVTVSGYGTPFELKPGEKHTISNIKQNINLVVSAHIYTVIYKFDNPASDQVATWVDVKLGSNPWPVENAGVQYIEKGKSFTFNCAIKTGINGRIVYVHENNADVNHSGNVYTLSNIESDKEVHIKAVKTYTVYYKFKDGTTPPKDFKIWKKTPASTDQEDWTTIGEDGKVTLDAGSNFDFAINQKLDITINNAPVVLNNSSYTISSIQEDKVIVLDGGGKPFVTIIDNTGKIDVTYPEHSDFVTSGESFTIKPKLPTDMEVKYEIKVYTKLTGSTSTGTSVTPNSDGSYTLTGVTKDTDLEIRVVRKGADMVIKASIVEWLELKNVPGGSIFPN